MKIALLATIRNNWHSAVRLVDELEEATEKFSAHDLSVWLIDNGSTIRPPSWNALAGKSRVPCHVIELRGAHPRDRALSTALGFLVCELEANFDAFLLLDGPENQIAKIRDILDTAAEHAGAVISGQDDDAGLWGEWFFRAGTGKSMAAARTYFIPAPLAEPLCHSSCAGLHLSASLLRLEIPVVSSPQTAPPRENQASSASFAERLARSFTALSVFREQALARATIFLFALSAFLASLTALGALLRAYGVIPTPHWMLAGLVLGALFCLPMAVVVMALTIHGYSLRELRPWTPALGSAALIRSVNRVKRGPYDLSAQAGP